MDKQARILALAQRLQQAGNRRDWQGLKRVDAEIAAQAAQWREGETWTLAERQALARLQAIHREASAQCSAEVEVLSQTLARINNQQSRWQAYAQSSHWGDSGL